MTKQEAKAKIKKYLDDEHIEYRVLNETEGIVPLERIDTIYLSCTIEDVIGHRIETSIRFREDALYCQSHYSQPVADKEEKKLKAAIMCNWMNHNLNWDCNTLFQHAYILDEDEGDVYNGFPIRYDILDDMFGEAMNHILNYSVQQIADVCIPLIFCLSGKYSYQEFKDYLKSNIMRVRD